MDADDDNSRKRVKLSPPADTTESSSSSHTPYHAHPPPQPFSTSDSEPDQQQQYSQPSNKDLQYLPTSPDFYASTQSHGHPPQQLPLTDSLGPYHQLHESQASIKKLTPAGIYAPSESHSKPPPQSIFEGFLDPEQHQKLSDESNKKFHLVLAAEKASKPLKQDSEHDWYDFLDPPSFADMDSMPIMPGMSKRPSRQKTSEPPPETIAIKPELIDDSEPAEALREYATTIKLECSACGRLGFKDLRDTVYRLSEQFKAGNNAGGNAPSELTIKINMPCERCAQITCMGCRVSGPLLVDQEAVHGFQIAWHCEQGKLVNTWFVLAAYDSMATHNKPRQRVFPKKGTKSMPARKNGGGGLPAGVGYDSGHGDEYLAAIGPPFGQVPQTLIPSGQFQPVGSVAGNPGGSQPSATENKLSDSLVFSDGLGAGQSPATPSWASFSTPGLGVGQSSGLLGSYGAMASQSARESAAVSPFREAATDPEDGLLTKVVAALLPALPLGAAAASPAGSEPPGLLVDMLLRSSLLDRVAEVLQNGTIEEICRRPAAFKAATDLVRAVASQPATSPAVFRPRRANRAGHNLLRVSLGKRTRMQVESDDESKSVMACLGDLAAKSRLMLQSAANMKDHQPYSLRELFICEDLVKLHEFMLVNAEDSANELRKDSAVTDDLERLKELAFLEVADEDVLSVHTYASAGQTMGVSKPGRFRALVKEVTILQDGLPPGIYVRYGSSRLDMMKILITGSQGTPYENGLFEFDLFCGENFPNSPPKMKFRTTGNGSVRFNPNLYNDGKVCLSLLGTWEGEPWKPGQSSILQILLSLQAMVMCEQPHCNEPGYEREHNTERSKDYNRRLLPSTVRYAMLEWLGEKQIDPVHEMRNRRRGLFDTDFDNLESAAKPARAGIWDDVVKHHFAVTEPAILATVDEWVKDKREHSARRERSMRTRAGATALEAERRASDQENKQFDEVKEAPAPQGLVLRLKAALEVLGVRGQYRSAQTPPMMHEPTVFQHFGPNNPASTGGSQWM